MNQHVMALLHPHAEPVVSRPHSSIQRCREGGRVLYVKRFTFGSEMTSERARARCRREGEVIERLAEIPGLGGHLGRLILIESRPAEFVLVTEEVTGLPLEECLGPDHAARPGRLRAAAYLAGRWLRLFQGLSPLDGDSGRIGSGSPTDLVEYCDIRLKALQNLGCDWVTQGVRQRLGSTLDSLCAGATGDDTRLVWSHGDYAPHNMIWDGATLTPIDFGMANLDKPLKDATYFIHRLEMMSVYFPWRSWPVSAWKRAFLRGYGRPAAEDSSMYEAFRLRHLLCRLQTYHTRPPKNIKQRVHNRWILHSLRAKLLATLDS